MKKTLALLAFLALFIVADAQSNDIDLIKKINADWLECFTKKDTAKLKNIFADDVVYVNGRGIPFDKKTILNLIMQPGREYKSASFDNIIQATVSGNTGMIIAQTITTRKLDDQENIFSSSVMNIFEKRNGKWLVIASHNTMLDVR